MTATVANAANSKPVGRRKPYKLTQAQELLKTHLKELGWDSVLEYTFCERRWRFDVYIPDLRVGIELDGGMWSGGHARGSALEDEYEKSNSAQLKGFRILRFTNRQVLSGQALQFLKENL